MERQLPTFGQLERNLSQNIQKLYREELEHTPQKVTSKFFGNRLVIVIEDALTAVEQTLISKDNEYQIVKNLNIAINDIIKPKLKSTIEAVLTVEVEDVLFGSTIETKRTGAIVILSQLPQVRSPKSILKIPKSQSKSEQDSSGVDDKSLTAIAELEKLENVTIL